MAVPATFISKLGRALRDPLHPRGLRRRLAWWLSDVIGDAALGVATRGSEEVQADPARDFYGYRGVAYSTLGDIGQHMTASGVTARRFVDVGCGLGRPLYVFADQFDDLIGYEVDPRMAERARRLLARAAGASPAFARISLVEADATEALPIDRSMVLFLYNPFGPGPMERLCARLVLSAAAIDIYYVNPVHGDVITRLLGIEPERVESFIPFHLYRRPGA